MADRHLDFSGGPTDTLEAVALEQTKSVEAIAARCRREVELAEQDEERKKRGDIPLSFIRTAQQVSEKHRRFGK